MTFLNDDALDALLNVIANNADELHICSQEPATFAEATSTYSLGSKSTPTVGSLGDGTPNGRKITVSAISDGSVDGTGTATHWALVDAGTSDLLVAGALASGQAVTNGNTFALGAFNIRQPDPS